MKDVKWIEGAPERLQPGMLVIIDGRVILIGHTGPLLTSNIASFESVDEFRGRASAYAWLIQPHEIEWLENMAKAHKVGRPAEGEGK